MSTHCSDGDFIGACKATVGTAELSAQAWTLAYVAYVAKHFLHDKFIELRYDSEYAAAMTRARWEAKDNHGLISLCNGLLNMVSQLTAVTFTHVKSHQGDPWNEAADVICTMAGNGAIRTFGNNHLFREWTGTPRFAEWAFLYTAREEVLAAYPPFDAESGHLDARPIPAEEEIKLEASIISRRIDAANQPQKQDASSEWISTASLNIQTLARTGKRNALAEQFRQHGIAIVGLQETRSESNTHFVSHGWLFIGSAAIDGDYGIDLWVDLQRVIGHVGDRKLKITRESVTAWHRSPRRLICIINTLPWDVCVVVGHAPFKDTEAWWADTYSLLKHHDVAGMDMIWLVDANGRIPAEYPPSLVGPVHDGLLDFGMLSGASDNISRGAVFADAISDNEMWLPATFTEYAKYSDILRQGTFKAGGEQKGVRIDYVALSSSIEAKTHSAHVLFDFDMRGLGEDHHQTVLTCKCYNGKGEAPFRLRKAAYNRTRPRTDKCAAEYATELRLVPHTRYEVEPSSHDFVLADNMSGILVSVCGTPTPIPTRPEIETCTVALCQMKGLFLDGKKKISLAIRRASLKTSLVAWKRNPAKGPWWCFRLGCSRVSGRLGDSGTRSCFNNALSDLYGFGSRGLTCRHIFVHAAIEMLEMRIQSAVVRDGESYKSVRFKDLSDALAWNKVSEMHTACDKLKVKVQRKHVRLKDKEGNVATRDRQERDFVKAHFGEAVEATTTTFLEMVVEERGKWSHKVPVNFTLDLAAVPSLTQVTTLCPTHTRQTAVAHDGLGSKAYSAAPA